MTSARSSAQRMPSLESDYAEEATMDSGSETLDLDLEALDREGLLRECRKLRSAIRAHRDSSGHDLCWYVPELWGLVPDEREPRPAPPPREEFLARCAEYRDSLPAAPAPPAAVLAQLRRRAREQHKHREALEKIRSVLKVFLSGSYGKSSSSSTSALPSIQNIVEDALR